MTWNIFLNSDGCLLFKVFKSKMSKPTVDYYIINIVFSQMMCMEVYGFRSDQCNPKLLEQIKSAYENKTCPPFHEEEAPEEEGLINFKGEALEFGSIQTIEGVVKDLDGKHQMKGCDDLVVLDFFI